MTTLREFLQLDTRHNLKRIGTEPWITVYSYRSDDTVTSGYFCALVPDGDVARVLAHSSWDLSIGDGRPGCSQDHAKRPPETTYHRFGDDDGIEPFVFNRSFHGIKPDYIELLEEFRHFHNLYHDHHNDRYIRITDGGDEEVVAEVTHSEVRVKTRAIRQFLAIRGMHLLVFFADVVRASINLEDIAIGDREVEHSDETSRYSFHVADAQLALASGKPFSRLLGKVAVPPLPLQECGIWPYDERKEQFAEFIIGLDAHGNPLHHTCEPDKLANFFGKNPNAPQFLTPVVFRREVLKKYYEHPEKYSVEDGYLRCGGLWGLKMDNDSADRVTVFLGDLGETLTYEEQNYWKSHNVHPEGNAKDLSDTNFRRSFLAEFADPKSPELVFKQSFIEFQEAWESRFGWQLIRSMQTADAHVIKRLHAPTTSSASEFDDQVLVLTKLLVDSLNDAELVKALGTSVPGEKSIAKLERFLTAKGYPETRRDIEFLHLLQESRSSMAAHRKGEGYKKIVRKLRLDNRSTGEVFDELLQGAILMLRGMKLFFLAA